MECWIQTGGFYLENNIDLSTKYDAIFKNKIFVITGVARSGTTIIGKITGSLENSHYIFEPSTFFLFPTLIKQKYLPKNQGGNLLKAILFEDFYLQMIQGRYVNFNEGEDSYIGNYINLKNFDQRCKKLKRKTDVLEYLKNDDCRFIIKNPNIQPCQSLLQDLFAGIKFIDVIRDGNAVVGSSVRRDFYSETFLNERNVEWSYETKGIKIPWFVDEKDRDEFSKWNHYTRSAYIWRILTVTGLEFAENNKNIVLQFKYEDFIKSPEIYVDKIENFVSKKRTGITIDHIESIRTYRYKDYEDFTSKIESPEKEKFVKLRKKLGYLNNS